MTTTISSPTAPVAAKARLDEACAQTLRAEAETAERQCRLTPDGIEALRRYGAFALRTPEAHGGLWASPSLLARRLVDLGRACPSAAWVAGTCATSKTIHAATFADSSPAEPFGDPDALACGSGTAVGHGAREADAVRITARWSYVSGCEDAAWANLGLTVDGTYSWVFVPIDALRVEGTWQTAGMRATGSHTLVADDVVVPADWVRPGSMPTPAERAFLGLMVLAPIIGAAYGALDVTEAMFASDRRPFTSNYNRMADSPGARQWLAEATHLLARAEQTMDAVAATAERDDLTEPEVAAASMALADAAHDSRTAVERMLDLNGTSGFAATNPLQRIWRDVAVGSRHPLLNPYLATERLGSALTA